MCNILRGCKILPLTCNFLTLKYIHFPTHCLLHTCFFSKDDKVLKNCWFSFRDANCCCLLTRGRFQKSKAFSFPTQSTSTGKQRSHRARRTNQACQVRVIGLPWPGQAAEVINTAAEVVMGPVEQEMTLSRRFQVKTSFHRGGPAKNHETNHLLYTGGSYRISYTWGQQTKHLRKFLRVSKQLDGRNDTEKKRLRPTIEHE